MPRSCPGASLLLLIFALTSPLAADGPRWKDATERLAGPLIEHGIVPSLVIGLYDEGHVEVYGFGSLRKKNDVPDGKTVYEIGSITKVFTGILLADAVRRSEVQLNDPLSKFLPKKVKAPSFEEQEITLLDLATHRSALPRIPDNMEATDLTDPYAKYDAKKMYEYLGKHTLTGAPGAQYAYSNLGMGLLGHLLGEVAKSDYPRLIEKRIARPLKMEDTTVSLTADQKRRFARPHRDGVPVQPWEFQALCGAGGLRSTVDDLMKFIDAHIRVEESPLAKTLPRALTRRSPNCGLGWHIAGDGMTYYHNGQTGGFSSGLYVCPKFKKGAVVLANGASGKVDVLTERLIQMLFGMAVEPPDVRPRAKVSEKELERLVGEYPSSLGFTIYVRHDGGVLTAQLTNQVAIRIHPSSATRFFYENIPAELEFELDAKKQKAVAVTLFQNGREMRCERKE